MWNLSLALTELAFITTEIIVPDLYNIQVEVMIKENMRM